MGLLDSVLGAAMGGNQQQGGMGAMLGSVLGSALGGQQQSGGMAGLGNMLGSVLGGGQQAGGINMATLAPVLIGLLSNRNPGAEASGLNGIDGLGGLMAKFQQAGLGDVIGSWVGGGQNQPINGDQLTNVLGKDMMGQIAQHLGVGQGEAAGALAQVLPGLVDKLTPGGQAPQSGFGNAGDLMGMLGKMMTK